MQQLEKSNPMLEKQCAMCNPQTRTMPNQQQKEKLIREEHYKTKKKFMKWNEAWASFLYKILTLNNAFTSLSDGCCLGTLNLKLIDWEPDGGSLWELVQFFQKKQP